MRLLSAGILAAGAALFAGLGPPRTARAQDANPLENVSIDQRVEVFLKSGARIVGEVSLVQTDRLRLDLTYDNSGVSGFTVIARDQIRTVNILHSRTDEERDQIRKARREEEANAAASSALEQTPETAGGSGGAAAGPGQEDRKEAEEAEKAEKLAQAKELAGRFPRSEGWTAMKVGAIRAREEGTWTPEEQEFVERYDEIAAAQDVVRRENLMALLDRFPPGEVWNAKKHEELVSKKNFGEYLPDEEAALTSMSEDEAVFLENYEDWQAAIEMKDKEERDKAAKEAADRKAPAAGADTGSPASAPAGSSGTAPKGVPPVKAPGGPPGTPPAPAPDSTNPETAPKEETSQ